MVTKIDLGNMIKGIDPEKMKQTDGSTEVNPDGTGKPYTGVGRVLRGIAGKTELERKLNEAQDSLNTANQKLAKFEGAEIVQLLDPKSIRRGRWANRHSSNFQGPDWQKFKEEISHSGGNVEPIKVRRIINGKKPEFIDDGVQVEYEPIFGQRRHQACLELGIPVRAVVIEKMDDKTLFAEMDRENRLRENLSAWEQGVSYNQALKEGLYTSIRSLSADLGVNLSLVSRYCKLAQLPDVVISAFPSPLAIQVRWSKPLSDSMQSDPEGTLERARKLISLKGTLTASEVLSRLVNSQGTAPDAPKNIEIQLDGKLAASLKVLQKGKLSVEFEAGAVKPEQHEALVKLIERFLENS